MKKKSILFRFGFLILLFMTSCTAPGDLSTGTDVQDSVVPVRSDTAAPTETPRPATETATPEPTSTATAAPTSTATSAPAADEHQHAGHEMEGTAVEPVEPPDTKMVSIPGVGEVPESTLLLPDLITLPPFDLRYLIDDENGKKYIRFSNAVWNSGPGDLELFGEMSSDGQKVNVTQWISTTTGSFVTLDVGEFIFHKVHNHYHWEGFSKYDVWSTDGKGNLLAPIASSGKVSYCLRDFQPITDFYADYEAADKIAKWPKFDSCYWEHQGLSVGWSDTYIEQIAGQAVDISGISDGVYALISTADPGGMLMEADETNNMAVIYFEIEGRVMRKVEEP